MTGQTREALSLSEQLVKPMEDLEGEYMPWIEMPVAGYLERTICLRTEQDQCMALAR
jgi:hypothetical protein